MYGRLSAWWYLVLVIAGCCHPIRTSSELTVSKPVPAQVTAEFQSSANPGPLAETTVIPGAGADCAKVALIDVDGLLVNVDTSVAFSPGDNPVSSLAEKLAMAASDPQVCAVVLRLNSPGGGVAASDIMWQVLMRFRDETDLPMVACLMDTGTGGAYYLATAADSIWAYPTSVVGGIGVVLNYYNLRDAMQFYNIAAEPVKAGEYIDMGTCVRPLTPEVRQWLQGMADEYHQRFKDVVIRQRPGVRGDVPTNFDGRVFTASQALDRGLIDRVGSLNDAISAARGRGGHAQARVVMYHRRRAPARTPFAVAADTSPPAGLIPISVPGFERSKLPLFLYLWQMDPTLEKATMR